jgi:Phage tail tube protein
MPPGIGASGFAGLALEAEPGVYTAPTKYFPFESESVNWTQGTTLRRPIRQTPDVIGAVLGNGSVAGDMGMEFLEDVVPYFLMCARTSLVKSGTAPNYIYTFKGAAGAIPNKTMSITIVRNGQVFGYTGVVVSSFNIPIADGMLKFNCSLIGREEAAQATPAPAFVNTAPFGAGSYVIELDGQVLEDSDSFTFTVEDNGTAQNRILNRRGAAFVSYGERNVTVAMDRDFDSRADYDSFKALTAQAVSLEAAKGPNNRVTIDLPVGFRQEYAVNLGGQGDLLRVSNTWTGAIDSTGNAYTLAVATQENITP